MVMMRLITTHDEDSLFEDSQNTACKVGCRSEMLIITMMKMGSCICAFGGDRKSDLDPGREIGSWMIICIHSICLHFPKSDSSELCLRSNSSIIQLKSWCSNQDIYEFVAFKLLKKNIA